MTLFKKIKKPVEKSEIGSPIKITLITIIGALLGTAIGAVLQGYWNTKLEREKFEYELIQNILQKEDVEEIKQSLLFYIDIGLIQFINKDSLRGIIMDEPNRLPSRTVIGPSNETISFTFNESGQVTFSDGWDEKSIKPVFIPQLANLNRFSGNVKFYEPAHQDLKNAFIEIEKEGLLKKIITWDGSFNARTVRGTSTLSAHALGIAFDINIKWNSLGSDGATIESEGSVLELVPIFKKHGFKWGGDYIKRKDPNHFYWDRSKE